MIREAREEVGLDLTGHLAQSGVLSYPARHTTTMFTACLDLARPTIRITRPFEVAAAAWFTPDELPDVNPFTTRVIAGRIQVVHIVDGRFVPASGPSARTP